MGEGGEASQVSPSKAASSTSSRAMFETRDSSVGATVLTPADTGVEQSVYLGYVRRELDDESSCMELPFTIILLLSFSCLSILHLNQQAVFAVEQSIELDIRENANFAWSHAFGHKSLADVHSIPDLWSWMRLGFIPLVVQPIWYTSEGYDDAVASAFATSGLWTNPSSDLETPDGGNETRQRWALPQMLPGEYLHFNHIVGGIRFRQQVADSGYDLCRFPGSAPDEIWFEWFGKPCYPAWEELSFVPDSGSAEAFTDPAPVTEWMLTDRDSLEQMLQQLVDMEDGCEQLEAKGRECYCESCARHELLSPWITERTQRVEITFTTINPEYGLITLTGVNFFFNRGSQIQKRVEVMSTWMDHFSKPGMDIIPVALCDVVWIVLMLTIFLAESKDVLLTMWKGGRTWYKSMWEDYIHVWNIVDWVSISMAFVAIFTFLQLWYITHELNEDFILLSEASSHVARDVYKEMINDFYDKVEVVCSNERSFRSLICVYPLIIMLRLFKSFAAQQRLAVVTATMLEASQDIFHFMIVWSAVFFCLCLDAIIIFGQDIHQFTTFPRSLHSCFRMMFGDWDWEPMQNVRRHYAMLWFWMFVVVVILILLNMLLAIIMEAYMEVKKNALDANTLQTQVTEMYRRRQQFKRRERVRLNDIWNAFIQEEPDGKKLLASKRKVTHEMVSETVPGIKEKQSRRTLENAYKAAHKSDAPFCIESAEHRIKALNDETSLVKDELFFTFDRVQHFDTMPEAHTDDPAAAVPQTIDEAADAAAVAAEAAARPAITEELLNVVGVEVGRLSVETASVLAQTMRRVDRRQGRCEQRQAEMLGAIREMSQNIQHLQSEASALTTKLHAYAHQQARSNPKRMNGRRGGTVMPACFGLSDPGQQPPGRPMDPGNMRPSPG